MSQVHFEVFRQERGSGSWSLVESLENHDEALERARRLLHDYLARLEKDKSLPLDRGAALDALAAELRALNISREEAVRAFGSITRQRS